MKPGKVLKACSILIGLLAIGAIVLRVPAQRSGQRLVTLQSLLDEMVSAEEQSKYPDPWYTCRQKSSHDRTTVAPGRPGWFGNNDGYKGDNFIRTDTINGRVERVMLDVTGPGAITRFWMTSLERKPVIRFYFDGAREPQWVIPAYDMTQFGVEGAGTGFLIPHTSYSADGSGGSTSFFPVPYAKGCRITLEIPKESEGKPRYYQINYRVYEPSARVETFSAEVARRARLKIGEVNDKLLHPAVSKEGKIENSVRATLRLGDSVGLALPGGQNAVYEIVFNIRKPETAVFERLMRQLIFTASFDGTPTVWAPVGDFSGGGYGAPAVSSWFLDSDGSGRITSRWIMPYRKKATIGLRNLSDHEVTVTLEAATGALRWDNRSLYFHAAWKQEAGLWLSNCNEDINKPSCREWDFATINGRGVYKGDVLSLYNYSKAWYGEGDEKIWVDGEASPSHLGTGTEDYYNSSWAPVVLFQTPFGGAPRADSASSHGYNTFFRTRNLDGIPFQNRFRFDFELLSWFAGKADYSSTVYWYGDKSSAATGTSGAGEARRPMPLTPRQKDGNYSPTLGWNSYDGYMTSVPEAELVKNIDAVAERLKPSGYEYVTVDNGWFLDGEKEPRKVIIDSFGLPESSPYYFPHGVKSVIDYAHSKGLKFGIWLIRGVERKAVEMNLPIEGTPYRLADIADKKDLCGWNDFNYGVDVRKPGAQEYYDNLVRKYAGWGVDFIKFDDIVPHPDEVLAVVRAVENCGREILLSLSPGDEIHACDSYAYVKANMVRITSDVWDNRGSIQHGFDRWEEMQEYPGAPENSWLDMDMIPFGRLDVLNNGGRTSRLTDDQKRTFMLQRALAASPLIAGGVLYDIDGFSLSLLTNKDILECDRNGVVGRLVHREGKIDVWNTHDRNEPGSGWIGIFNRDEKNQASIKLGYKDLWLDPAKKNKLISLWDQKVINSTGPMTFEIAPDGCVFIRYALDTLSGTAKVMPKATITIDAAAPSVEYSPMIFGGFLEHFDRQVYGGIFEPGSPLADKNGFRTDVIAALKELKTPIVRWPGGCYVSGYHWETGVGLTRQPTEDMAWGVLEPNTFGTNEYVNLCRLAGWEPYICNNAGNGTVAEMKNWVEYCNGANGSYAALRRDNGIRQPLGVKIWSIGNENWGQHEIGYKPIEQWAPLVLEAAKAMKSADPDIRLSAAALPSREWTLPLLRLAGPYLDYISIHNYWLGLWQNNDMPDYLTCIMQSDGPERSISDFLGVLDESGYRGKIKIAYDEWNLRGWHHPGFPRKTVQDRTNPEVAALIAARAKSDIPSQYTMADAIFSASFLNACLRHAEDVGMANIAPLVNTRGPLYVYPQGIVRRTHFHAMAMYANELEPRVGRLNIRSDRLFQGQNSVAAVDAVATVDASGKSWSIALVNRDPASEAACTVSLANRNLNGDYPAVILAGDSPEAYNDTINPNRVVPVKTKLTFSNGVVRLPAHSICIVKISMQ